MHGQRVCNLPDFFLSLMRRWDMTFPMNHKDVRFIESLNKQCLEFFFLRGNLPARC